MEVRKKYDQEELTKVRQSQGIYSIRELSSMFQCGRSKIDNAINTGQLNYLSPNNRDRYVFLNDFLKYMKRDLKGERYEN